MKKIELQSLHLVNFKGVSEAYYGFGETTDVRGANGSGKSTVYEAYLWAIFGKNPMGGEGVVRPLDKNNEPIHNVVTEVEVGLFVDNFPVKIKRTQTEKWKKERGSTEMRFDGLETKLFYNGVPMARDKEFIPKLNEIANVDDWFMVSSLSIIPGMKQEDRRRKLAQIAPHFEDKSILAKYPAVADALAKNITIEALKAMTVSAKSKANEELNMIPARIDEQERSRVTDDFATLHKQEAALDAVYNKCISEEEELQKGFVVESSMALQNEIRDLKIANAKEDEKLRDEYMMEHARLEGALRTKQNELRKAQLKLSMCETDARNCKRQLEEGRSKIAELRDRYIKKRGEKYDAPSINTVCPTCGQPLPAENIERARAEHYSGWNQLKATALKAIEDDAVRVKERITTLDSELKRIESEATETSGDIARLNDEIKSAQESIDAHKMGDYSEDYVARIAKIELLNGKVDDLRVSNDAVNAEMRNRLQGVREKKAEVYRELQTVRAALLREGINASIDKRIDELHRDQQDYAQAVANAEQVLAQIAGYKKARIDLVEQAVSSLFTMVKWKMYQPTIDGDPKEICQAVINGVPYEQQNRATQMNAAVDMINGFCRGLGFTAPLFIDNKESVSELIETESQTITLTVAPGEELNIQTL